MYTPKFIIQLNIRVTELKSKLWKRSENSLNQLQNENTNKFIRVALIISILTILFSVFLVVRENIKGDYPIYSDQRIGAICYDGWVSGSTGSGTCSHHGGVKQWRYLQIDFHQQNTKPYTLAILFSILFMLLLSMFSIAFRHMFGASLYEAAYVLGFILYIIIYFATYLLFNLYLIFRYFKPKNESS